MNDCIFCKIVKKEVDCWKVFENEYVIAFFDMNPRNKYHTLVIPKKHSVDLFDTKEKDLIETMKAIKAISKIYKEKLGIENIQIINNSGIEAQQEVLHLHFHIIPRFNKDGQDLEWKSKPELLKEFDSLLMRLED